MIDATFGGGGRFREIQRERDRERKNRESKEKEKIEVFKKKRTNSPPQRQQQQLQTTVILWSWALVARRVVLRRGKRETGGGKVSSDSSPHLFSFRSARSPHFPLARARERARAPIPEFTPQILPAPLSLQTKNKCKAR